MSMQLDDVLKVEDVHLSLGATDRVAAIEEVLAKLNGDDRVPDWEALRSVILSHDAADLDSPVCGICLAHGRLSGLKGLVVAAGRSDRGVASPEGELPSKLIFVVGIPTAMNAQYLSVIGSVARVCNNKRQLDQLLNAKSPEEFVAALQSGCETIGR